MAAHVTGDFPPTYIADGNNLTFPQHGKALAAALQEKGVNVRTMFFDGSDKVNHQFQFELQTQPGRNALTATLDFLSQHSALR